MKAIILAGGKGTRLRTVVNDRPKPMAIVNGKPFLEYLIINLKRKGIKDIILSVGFMYENIKEFFGDGKNMGVKITYSVESTALGTGGAIINCKELLDSGEDVIVLNGDTYFDIDFERLIESHKNKSVMLSMALREVEDITRYGAVEFDKNNYVTNFIEKDKESISKYINGGIYIINSKLLDEYKNESVISFENDIIPYIIKKSKINVELFNNYFIDIGIPNDYYKFCRDIEEVKI